MSNLDTVNELLTAINFDRFYEIEARHAEEAGRPDPAVRGMPLGLPPIPLEDIQLVESWIAQGRPQ